MLRAPRGEAMQRRRRPPEPAELERATRARASRPGALPLIAFTFLLAAAEACAPPAPRPDAVASPSPAAVEDARSSYFAESEVDQPARPLAPIEPAYPPQLRALGVEGEVEARVVVLADGSVGRARLVASSDEAFTASVRDALASARFQPAERGGRAVASWLTLRLRFRMEE